jgi:signal transduction histidine kinase
MTRILIVDDNDQNLYYLDALLRGNGYVVDSARHGAEALVKARQQMPDVVISDLLMPVMDGYTLLRHWKLDEVLKHIPFIVYTATYTEAEDERLALNLGADAFILKPTEPEAFLARVREVQDMVVQTVSGGPRRPGDDETSLLRSYSQTLIRKLEEKSLKLEEKTLRLEETNRALQQELAERRKVEAALQQSLLELNSRNRELQEFAFVASHDLQEPLRKIQTFSDVLVMRHRDALDEYGRDYLDRMSRAAARMKVLIEDLLEYSRVASGTRPFAPVNLTTVCREVLVDLESRIEATQAQVILSELATINSDATQMRQLFQNLLANALKFRSPDRHPEIRISCTHVMHADRPAIRLEIADNGIGFDAKFAGKIFNPFQRLHTRTEYEGTGIGLAIVRRIVERHRGSIETISEVGQGARFIVTLPISPIPREPQDQSS